ncbi:MAG: alpha/beta fold hydrolase [Bacteroidales bacterium]
MEYFATINGIPLHISDTKTGDKTILLLHGYLETLYIWEEFTSILAPYFRVVSIDIPGHGLSHSPAQNSMEFCAGIADALLEKLKIKKAAILGHSMGGYVALEAIKRYPDRFGALILMNSSPFADSSQKIEERKREIELIRQNKLMNIIKLSIPKMFATHNKSKMEEKILEIVETAEVHDPEGVITLIEAMMARTDNSEFLRETATPLFLIFGKHDNYISYDAANNYLLTMKNPNFIFLENSGHSGFLEEPKYVAEKCVEFVNKCDL